MRNPSGAINTTVSAIFTGRGSHTSAVSKLESTGASNAANSATHPSTLISRRYWAPAPRLQ